MIDHFEKLLDVYFQSCPWTVSLVSLFMKDNRLLEMPSPLSLDPSTNFLLCSRFRVSGRPVWYVSKESWKYTGCIMGLREVSGRIIL